jgi:protein Mpv17
MSIPIHQFFTFTNKITQTFAKNPMLSNSCTGFLIFASGDVCSQYFKDNSIGKINFHRVLQTGSIGIFMNGIMLHYWYRSLDHLFGTSMKKYGGVILKVLMDQIVYAPFSIGIFFSMASVSQGGDVQTIMKRLQEKTNESFLETWATDCMLWPIVNFLNFRFVPIHLRPTFVGFAQLMWQTYMSTVGYRECKPITAEIVKLQPPNFSPPSVAFN